MLSFERMDVYRVAVELRGFVTGMGKRGNRELRDQIDRASASVILNVAEGCGRWQGPDRRRFYEIARGSACETAAVLACLKADGTISEAEHQAANELVTRVVQMLTKLCQRLRSQTA